LDSLRSAKDHCINNTAPEHLYRLLMDHKNDHLNVLLVNHKNDHLYGLLMNHKHDHLYGLLMNHKNDHRDRYSVVVNQVMVEIVKLSK
jgi:hypothetical protein